MRTTKSKILDWLAVDQLKGILGELQLPSSGSKAKLVDRLLEDEGFDPEMALDCFDLDDLISFCNKEGLDSTGLEKDLRGDILQQISAEEGEGPERHVLLGRRLRRIEKNASWTEAWTIVGVVVAVFAAALVVSLPTVGLNYGLLVAGFLAALIFVAMIVTEKVRD